MSKRFKANDGAPNEKHSEQETLPEAGKNSGVQGTGKNDQQV
jgi:hypothetical protein